MQIKIESQVIERYPDTEIGYILAKVQVKKSDPKIERLKSTLAHSLKEKDITRENYKLHPNIEKWRDLFKDEFNISPSKYPSSVESLIGRIVKGQSLWSICNIVDAYNIMSVLHLLPMGGYDFDAIEGDISLRYGKEGEMFQGLGEKQSSIVSTNHIVYADERRILCWLWNYKDAAATCITPDTKYALFFIDSDRAKNAKASVHECIDLLQSVGATILQSGILDGNTPLVTLVKEGGE